MYPVCPCKSIGLFYKCNTERNSNFVETFLFKAFCKIKSWVVYFFMCYNKVSDKMLLILIVFFLQKPVDFHDVLGVQQNFIQKKETL